VNTRDHKILAQDKQNLKRRLRRKNWTDQATPMFGPANLHYEMAERTRAICHGGVGVMHTLVGRLGLEQAINQQVPLLATHVPYFESDHVLNIAYNVLTGGTCLEDIEPLRQDDTYSRSLNAERIPDPTTAGDFLRRFDAASLLALQETFNQTRQKVWAKQDRSFHQEAILEVDGAIAPTTGACKAGMDLSYNGIWGYHPLIISLAHTREVLYLVNRPGNQTSSSGAAPWIDRAIDQVAGRFQKVWLRGDTDFALTEHFDRWSERAEFVFGYDAYPNLVDKADQLPQSAWKPLDRPPRYEVKTDSRERPNNVKEQIVKQRQYRNIRLDSEQVAEFDYRPTQCRKTYRMVVVRKNLSVEKGEAVLFDDLRYFFYITTDRTMSPQGVVLFANDRCHQENTIAQLKSGVHALRMPTNDFDGNWAYMVIATLAWNLKAWYGLLGANKASRREILRMEFKRFLRGFIQIPCQIVTAGRRLVYRVLCYKPHLEAFLASFEAIRRLRFT
jgi:Transposase DDE domain group 1